MLRQGTDQHVRFALIIWYAEKNSHFVGIKPQIKKDIFDVYVP